MNPLKRIPIVQDGDFTLSDSSAICGYFEAKYSDVQTLFPSEAMAYGRTLWIEEYADTVLFKSISEGVFRPIFINQFRGKPVDQEAVEEALGKTLPPVFLYLEKQLEGRTWFSGGKISVADLSVYSQLVNLVHARHLPSAESYPNLIAHFKRIQTRPTAVKLHSSEVAYLEKMLEMLSKRNS